MKRPELDIVAINELGDIDNLAYLLKYDSAYGKSDFHIAVGSDKKKLIVDGKEIAFVSEKTRRNYRGELWRLILWWSPREFSQVMKKRKFI